ncbi:hypothetical protein HU765_09775 [Pseudomonas sp. SWRI81]|uniref:hypothetical protein n=1 Tax=Pseudomonas sp. SWRI81 TaxID=2745505 RepID=UPI00164764A7|nr:hypothetical protein [Pseudomonas sp. SWRI81]MBC3270214.1 hypothetical protein [Pseudomonas sp. SWRI81]
MAIRLELLTEDPKEIELIQRYWAINESGQFLEKVNALSEVLQLPQGVTLAAFIRQRCRAFDENQMCPECDEWVEIRNRSQAWKSPLRSTTLCTRCQEERDALAREAEKTKAARLEVFLAEHHRKQASRVVDYAAVADAQVLLLLALDRAVTPRLTEAGFTLADCRGLAPRYRDDFLKTLKDAGLLLEDPSKAKPGTYYWEGDEVWQVSAQVAYLLMPGTTAADGDEVIRALSERSYTDADGIFSLWLDYAIADVMCYLGDYCKWYGHELAEQEWDEVKSTLRAALQTYSISQLWFVAWKVVKDAASLASHPYYNRVKAAATIPGKIRRYLEKVKRESLELRSWSRPELQPAGTLGMLFGELFGIDEHTSGVSAAARIAHVTGRACASGVDAELCAPIRELMVNALALDAEASVMLRFAELIRAGYDVGFAVEEIGVFLQRERSGDPCPPTSER